MRKTLNSFASRFLSSMMLLTMLLAGSSSVKADDLGALELGVSYSLPAFKSTTATFTAPATGVMVMTVPSTGAEWWYTDAACSTQLSGKWNGQYGPGCSHSYQVTEGVTYYFNTGFAWDSYQMVLTMDGVVDKPYEVVWIEPRPDRDFGMTNNDDDVVMIKFNQELTSVGASVRIRVNDVASSNYSSTYRPGASVDGDMIVISNVKKFLKDNVNSGFFTPGDKITFQLNSIKKSATETLTCDGVTNGVMEISYTVANIAIVKTAETIPADFKSYWVDDPSNKEGIFTLTFDGDLYTGDDPNKQPDCWVRMGNLEGGTEMNDFHSEWPTVTVNGNTLSVDLRGVRRTKLDMFPISGGVGGGDMEHMLVSFRNIRDSRGNFVDSEGQGTTGSYHYMLNYNEIEKLNLACDYTPANGTTAQGASEISIWVSDNAGSGTWTPGKLKVTYKDADGAAQTFYTSAMGPGSGPDPNGGFVLALTAADIAKLQGASDITIQASNDRGPWLFYDGYDHMNDFKVQYDTFTLTELLPEAGTEMASLNQGDVIKAWFNYAEQYPEMYVMYDITDLDATNAEQAVIKTESWMYRQADGHYEAEVYGNYKMLLNHRYEVKFTAWETEMAKNYREPAIGEATAIWFGTTAPFRYSPLTMTEAIPAEGTMLTKDDNVFIVKFDGGVNLNAATSFINQGQGMEMPYESIEPVGGWVIEETNTTYASEWKLTVPASYMASLTAKLMLVVVATDEDGLMLKGNEGEEETTYFSLVYDVEAAYKDFEVFGVAYGEPVEMDAYPSLKQVYVYCEEGIMPSYNYEAGPAQLFDMNRNLVATVVNVETFMDDEKDEDGNYISRDVVNTQCLLTFDNEITANGTYVLSFPVGYFIIGQDMATYQSQAKMVNFTVQGSAQATVTTDPAEGGVESLSVITLDFGTAIGFPWNGVKATLTAEDGTIVKEFTQDDVELIPVDPDDMWSDFTKMKFDLGTTITEAGKYTLNLPAKFYVAAASYAFSAPMSFTWEVGAEPVKYPVASEPAEGNVEAGKISQVVLTFYEQEEIGLGQGKATMTITPKTAARAAAQVVTLPDAELDWDFYNVAIQPLGDTYEADGTYEINFPAGYFTFGPEGNELSPAIKMTYTIGDLGTSTAIVEVGADVNGKFVVYNLNGVKVLDTDDAAAVKTLAPGIYIVNGIKTLVK